MSFKKSGLVICQLLLGSSTLYAQSINEQPSQIELTKEDKALLDEKITMPFPFPTDAKDKIINQASEFINLKYKDSVSYNDLLKEIEDEDTRLSKKDLIPGAFLNASADLFKWAATDVSSDDFPNSSKDKAEQEAKDISDTYKDFATILDKKAKIADQTSNTLEDRIQKLEDALNKAEKEGKPLKKVYIYSDDPSNQGRYDDLTKKYPDTQFIYTPFPNTLDIFIDDARDINDGYIFIDVIPRSYAPLYSPVWFPFYGLFLLDNPYFLGFGYPYNYLGWWNDYATWYGPRHWDKRHNWDNWSHDRFGDRNWHRHHRNFKDVKPTVKSKAPLKSLASTPKKITPPTQKELDQSTRDQRRADREEKRQLERERRRDEDAKNSSIAAAAGLMAGIGAAALLNKDRHDRHHDRDRHWDENRDRYNRNDRPNQGPHNRGPENKGPDKFKIDKPFESNHDFANRIQKGDHPQFNRENRGPSRHDGGGRHHGGGRRH